jgi:hypothetical protein
MILGGSVARFGLGPAKGREVGGVTVVTPRSGFDLECYLERAGEKTTGGYYLNAAQQGSRLAAGSAGALRP